jgi:hypothetical protein
MNKGFAMIGFKKNRYITTSWVILICLLNFACSADDKPSTTTDMTITPTGRYVSLEGEYTIASAKGSLITSEGEVPSFAGVTSCLTDHIDLQHSSSWPMALSEQAITFVSPEGDQDGSRFDQATNLAALEASEVAYLSLLPGTYQLSDLRDVGSKVLAIVSPCWASVNLVIDETLSISERDFLLLEGVTLSGSASVLLQLESIKKTIIRQVVVEGEQEQVAINGWGLGMVGLQSVYLDQLSTGVILSGVEVALLDSYISQISKAGAIIYS